MHLDLRTCQGRSAAYNCAQPRSASGWGNAEPLSARWMAQEEYLTSALPLSLLSSRVTS